MMRFLILAAVLAPAAMAGDAMADLQACRSLGDAARLACFDRVLAAQDAKPGFGAERLPQAAETAKAPEAMQARITAVRLNAFKQFTVTLDNGQVWRQLDSDTAVARLAAADAVKITRGFLDSYSLSVEGAWGSYKVKRIK